MKFDCLPLVEATDEHWEAWRRLRRSDPALSSPLFSCELALELSAGRRRTELGVVRDQGEIVALLPFDRQRTSARPLAGPLADFQGAIAAPGSEFPLLRMMRDWGLATWHFHAQLAGQVPFARHQLRLIDSPFIDISAGFETYYEERRAAGSHELREGKRKQRKIQRERGDLRFNASSENPDDLRQILAWKDAQLDATGRFNGLAVPWVRQFLHRLPEVRYDDCQGMVCSLHVGDELAAGALTVRSGPVLHGWVMAFNPELRKYSPGILLLIQLLEAAEELGIRRIDMGRGPEKYKQSFCTGAQQVAEGAADRKPWMRTARRCLLGLRERMGDTPLRRWLRSWVNHRRYAGQGGR